MKISVIGAAGYVGSNVAIVLALQGLADELVLVDPYKQNIVIQLAWTRYGVSTCVEISAGDYGF
jgi:malate/lactate dehydrogenase